MFDIQHTIDIAAPPSRVWEITTDLDRWPEWTPTVTAIEVLDPGPLHVGQRARLHQLGYRPAVWRVTEVTPDRSFTWETRTLGLRARGHHLVEPAGAGTEATLAVDVSGPTALLFGWLVARASRRFLPQEASGLKARAETTNSPA